MQKYARKRRFLVKKMQKICKSIQIYRLYKTMDIYAQYMHKYAKICKKYAIMHQNYVVKNMSIDCISQI